MTANAQVDLMQAKVLAIQERRIQLGVDFFNLINASPVTAVNNSFDVWQRPNDVLISRFARLGAQIDF